MGNAVSEMGTCTESRPKQPADIRTMRSSRIPQPTSPRESLDSLLAHDTPPSLREEDDGNGKANGIRDSRLSAPKRVRLSAAAPEHTNYQEGAEVDPEVEQIRMDRKSLDERLLAMAPPPGQKRPSMVHRLSQFTSGMLVAVTMVQEQKSKLVEEGMTAPNFAFGVINALVTTFIVAAMPENYWLYYAFQSFILLLVRTVSWLQLYLLDFCWIYNFLLSAAGLAAAFDQLLRPELPDLLGVDVPPLLTFLPADTAAIASRFGWPLIFIVSTGPLTWAVAATGNSLVFHSFEHTASMFIHASPMIAAWTLRWNGEAVEAAYPGLLGQPQVVDGAFLELFMPALAFYVAWWLPYTLWLVIDGVTCADKGYDTVFANFAPVVMGQLGITSKRCAAFSYMQFHLVACSLTFAVAVLAYHVYLFHTILMVLMLISAIMSGSRVYSYYMLDVYDEKLRSIAEDEEKLKELSQRKVQKANSEMV